MSDDDGMVLMELQQNTQQEHTTEHTTRHNGDMQWNIQPDTWQETHTTDTQQNTTARHTAETPDRTL
jgi:hypothetical protein